VSWKYNNKEVKSIADVPKSAIGFVYLITDSNGKRYVGKKQFFSNRNAQVSKAVYDKAKSAGEKVKKTKDKKKSKKGAVSWKYKKNIIKETDWISYCGSSIPLKKAVKNGLKIEKEILQYCYNKKQLSYYEMKWQVCLELIENPETTWNGCVAGKYYPRDLINKS